MSRRFANDNDKIICGNTNIPGPVDLTAWGLARISTISNRAIIFGTDNSWRLGIEAGGNLAFFKTAVAGVFSNLAISINTKFLWAMKVDEDTNVKFWRKDDGASSYTTETIAETSAMSGAALNIRIGSHTNDTEGWRNDIQLVGCINILLSDATIEQILDELRVGTHTTALAQSPGIHIDLTGSVNPEEDLSSNNNDGTVTGATSGDNLYDAAGSIIIPARTRMNWMKIRN